MRVVIVGAGSAGIPCAIEAARAGAEVVLIDRSDGIGGTLHVSGGHLSAAGARRQRALGIDDDPDRHYDDIQRISGGTADPELTRLAVELAPATIDWLDDLGFEFAPETPRIVHGHEPYTRPRTYYGRDEARSILAVLERALAPHLGVGVDLRLDTRVVGLLTDGGSVVGVEVETPDGRAECRGDAVVLATGGYGAAPDIFAELHRAPLVTAARPTSTGDGLRLARAIGAAIVGAEHHIPTFGGLPSPDDPGRVVWHDRPLLVAPERDPWEVYVDRHGRRFVAEDEPSIDVKERALADVADLTFFTVFDDRAVEESRDIVVGWSADDLRARAGVRLGIHVADTIRALALDAGIDPEGLAATVAAYNGAVAAGHDPAFGRRVLPAPIERPPFVAMRNHGVTLITFAGVSVGPDLAVRRADGTAVPGLFAVGEVIGAAATMGNAFCSGMSLTPALALGRRLGRSFG